MVDRVKGAEKYRNLTFSCKYGDIVYLVFGLEWNDEKESITSHHVLRLIYQGRFLHENVTFTGNLMKFSDYQTLSNKEIFMGNTYCIIP